MSGVIFPAKREQFKVQQDGKILHVGVNNVNAEELQAVMRMGEIATMENMYGQAKA